MIFLWPDMVCMGWWVTSDCGVGARCGAWKIVNHDVMILIHFYLNQWNKLSSWNALYEAILWRNISPRDDTRWSNKSSDSWLIFFIWKYKVIMWMCRHYQNTTTHFKVFLTNANKFIPNHLFNSGSIPIALKMWPLFDKTKDTDNAVEKMINMMWYEWQVISCKMSKPRFRFNKFQNLTFA